jgi:hypothetical protein
MYLMGGAATGGVQREYVEQWPKDAWGVVERI